MDIDWGSFVGGGVAVMIFAAIALFAFISVISSRIRDELKYVLGKLYSRTSLMMIAIFDVVAAFDPSQTLLGLGLAPITGLVILGTEWGFYDRFQWKRLPYAIVEGLIAAVIVMIPFPIAGIFVAWFGTVGDKKKQSKKR